MHSASKRLLRSLGLLVLVLAGLNMLVHFTARTSQRRQMLARLQSLSPETDCVFLGTSLVEAGCDVAAFASAWSLPGAPASSSTRKSPGADPGAPRAVNLALGATTSVEQCLVLDEALRRPLHLKYLIYGFADDQLSARVRGDWADLVGNRAFSCYFPERAAALYAPGSRLKKWQLRLLGSIPIFAERSSLWSKIELFRRSLEDVGMPKHKTNRFGRVEDFSGLEPADFAAFTNRCARVLAGRETFSPPIHEIIELAQSHGAHVILVEMPQPSRHRQLFYSSPAWNELRAYLQSLARRENATYLAASDWVKEDRYFEDAVHLNEAGAKLFSAQLAAAIAHPAE